jgi:hypothetical protein
MMKVLEPLQEKATTGVGKSLVLPEPRVGHAPKDQSNRRKYMPDYAVWEIHPVMKLTTLTP